MRRALLLCGVLGGVGCTQDVCARFSGDCLALEVRAAPGESLSVDQLELRGLSGFDLPDANDAFTPPQPRAPATLPVQVAVVPPADFSGTFQVEVRGLLAGNIERLGYAIGSLDLGKHLPAGRRARPQPRRLDGDAASISRACRPALSTWPGRAVSICRKGRLATRWRRAAAAAGSAARWPAGSPAAPRSASPPATSPSGWRATPPTTTARRARSASPIPASASTRSAAASATTTTATTTARGRRRSTSAPPAQQSHCLQLTNDTSLLRALHHALQPGHRRRRVGLPGRVQVLLQPVRERRHPRPTTDCTTLPGTKVDGEVCTTEPRLRARLLLPHHHPGRRPGLPPDVPHRCRQ